MNKKFLQLNKSALDSGLLQLNPGLAQEFDNVTETFSGLVKSAMEGQHDSDEEQGDAADNSPEQHKQTETKPEHVGWGYSIPGSTPKVSFNQFIRCDVFSNLNLCLYSQSMSPMLTCSSQWTFHLGDSIPTTYSLIPASFAVNPWQFRALLAINNPLLGIYLISGMFRYPSRRFRLQVNRSSFLSVWSTF